MRDATKILVAGGGPAGATAAGLLAKEGFEVTLIESERFPRYHIGESLLPSCLHIIDLLGAREKVERHGFVRKDGAHFEWGPENWQLSFDHLEGGNDYGFQVIRSEFDKLLLDHAAEQGAQVHEGVALRGVEFDGDRAVRAQWASTDGDGARGTIEFDHLVDATGRAGVLSTKYLKNRKFHDVYKNIAFWGYWEGVAPFDRGPAGGIIVRSTAKGWFWLIPLHDGRISVGFVMNKNVFQADRDQLGSMEAVYEQCLADAKLREDLLATGDRVTGLKADQDFTYMSETFAGPGYLLAGDSACFLDPLLSTGVHLATFSGLLAAASLSSVLRGEHKEEQALAFYGRAYRQAYERLVILVSFLYRDFDRGAQLFEADKLTRREHQLVGLYESFLHVATGVEDMHDIKEHDSLDVVAARLASSGHLFGRDAMGAYPSSPQTTVAGLYLVTEPRLGLRGVEASQPALS
ncbi:NAD(P)/FAD-dependent oxidoreductase [Solihabitans fulvus]|uniref:NAD(P)/FAD-dependent oxidoreductase n=1 Tax=Solihabitans fulvus TaxID=1892852 RepID=A0A5B2WHD6_9PSEU|nr:NAD(P)/FAD-dependent oxidoreductase [Solihabitans fulvus]KAA2250150.1 NAD(P)/FAD-dependent oxidoreductase [Solihabitans fulvus]